MPFKTKRRKQKIRDRQITISSQGLAIYESKKIIDSDVEIKDANVKSEKIKDNSKEYNYVKEEAVKIFILALVIIGLQIILAFSNIAL